MDATRFGTGLTYQAFKDSMTQNRERLEAADSINGRGPIVIELPHEMAHEEALTMLGIERTAAPSQLLLFIGNFAGRPGLPRLVAPAPVALHRAQ